jgi:hypothetical protein
MQNYFGFTICWHQRAVYRNVPVPKTDENFSQVRWFQFCHKKLKQASASSHIIAALRHYPNGGSNLAALGLDSAHNCHAAGRRQPKHCGAATKRQAFTKQVFISRSIIRQRQIFNIAIMRAGAGLLKMTSQDERRFAIAEPAARCGGGQRVEEPA